MRFLVQHQAGTDGSFEVDYASLLSRRGLLIATRKAFAPQETLHVQFAPRRDAQVVSAFCRVQAVTPQGVHAEFLDLDAEAGTLIDSLLN